MSKAQQRFGAAGVKSCWSRFSARPSAQPALLQGRRPRRVLARSPALLQHAGDAMATNGSAGRRQFLVDPRRAVKAPVLLEHGLDFRGDQGVIRLPLSRWCLLSVLPGVVTAAGHSKPAAEPGDGVLTCELIDQAKPIGGSCSFAYCAAASLKKRFPS